MSSSFKDGGSILPKIPATKYREIAAETNWAEFEKVLRSRRSVRVYTGEAIPEVVVQKCLDMALLAPNSSNLQPWEFHRVISKDKKALLVQACLGQSAARTAAELIVCVARIKTWQRNARQNLKFYESLADSPKSLLAYYQKIVPLVYSQGPVGIFGLIKRPLLWLVGFFRPTPRAPVGKADMRIWAHKSTALACENLMLAFRAAGFDTCPMEGMDENRIRKILKLDSDAEVCMVISAGRRAENGVYGPQIRFARDQFVKQI
jgi:nitroreductase